MHVIDYHDSLLILCNLIPRARKIVQGSVDDIGWHERAEGMQRVEDGTQRCTKLPPKSYSVRCIHSREGNCMNAILV